MEALMRARAIAAIVVLLLPAELSAQRLPLPGTRRKPPPAHPAPLPPQAGPIARSVAYYRVRLSVEGYPLVTHMMGAGLTETSFGFGTRAAYRLTDRVSATLDFTESVIGSPTRIETIELGARMRPERSDRRAYPFIDLRLGYARAMNGHISSGSMFVFPSERDVGGYRYSSGPAAVAGIGMEYDLSARWSLTTAASALQSFMTARNLFQEGSPVEQYGMTALRWTVGLRYNPVRAVSVPGIGPFERPR
jgi:hypothetical protein